MGRYGGAGWENVQPEQFEKQAYPEAQGVIAGKDDPEETDGQGPIEQRKVYQEAETGEQGKKKALARMEGMTAAVISMLSSALFLPG